MRKISFKPLHLWYSVVAARANQHNSPVCGSCTPEAAQQQGSVVGPHSHRVIQRMGLAAKVLWLEYRLCRLLPYSSHLTLGASFSLSVSLFPICETWAIMMLVS